MFHVEHFGELVVHELETHLKAIGISLQADQEKLLALYASELHLWNKRINLTALTNPREVAIKHFLDSMYGTKILEEYGQPKRVLDVGSGAGFPGLPLKVVHPGMSIYLLEKVKKKSSFLISIIGKLRLENAFVLDTSLEEVKENHIFQDFFDCITLRAVRAEAHFDLLTRLLVPGGRIILYRSKPLEENAKIGGLKISAGVAYSLPFGYGMRHLSSLEKC